MTVAPRGQDVNDEGGDPAGSTGDLEVLVGVTRVILGVVRIREGRLADGDRVETGCRTGTDA